MVAAIMGLLVERFIMRPLLGQPMMALVMVTIALTEILRGGVITYWGALDLRYVTIIPEGTIRMGFVAISNQQLASVLVTLALFAVILLLFRYSRWGLAMRAVAEGHQLVRSMGISVRTILGITWAIAAVVATLGGVLLGSIGGFGISMWEIALMAIPAAFIGGLDSVHGAIVGGLIVGVLEKVINLYVGFAFGLPAAFLVLVLIMFFRPYGIWGLIRIERV
ncbi:MAG: branched-chain amino acid ABC transporter permease [Chloroflexota bacterium]